MSTPLLEASRILDGDVDIEVRTHKRKAVYPSVPNREMGFTHLVMRGRLKRANTTLIGSDNPVVMHEMAELKDSPPIDGVVVTKSDKVVELEGVVTTLKRRVVELEGVVAAKQEEDVCVVNTTSPYSWVVVMAEMFDDPVELGVYIAERCRTFRDSDGQQVKEILRSRLSAQNLKLVTLVMYKCVKHDDLFELFLRIVAVRKVSGEVISNNDLDRVAPNNAGAQMYFKILSAVYNKWTDKMNGEACNMTLTRSEVMDIRREVVGGVTGEMFTPASESASPDE